MGAIARQHESMAQRNSPNVGKNKRWQPTFHGFKLTHDRSWKKKLFEGLEPILKSSKDAKPQPKGARKAPELGTLSRDPACPFPNDYLE